MKTVVTNNVRKEVVKRVKDAIDDPAKYMGIPVTYNENVTNPENPALGVLPAYAGWPPDMITGNGDGGILNTGY